MNYIMADINNEFVYLTIPYEYLCTYQRLLNYMADFGEDALKNCDTTCKGSNKNVIKCWNMFQADIAAKAQGKDKLADVLIKYIDAQLTNIYRVDENEAIISGVIYPVDERGYVYGDFTCMNGIEFFVPTVDGEDGGTCDGEPIKAWNLYVRFYGVKSEERDFDFITDENKDLIIESNYII